ncbi:hypothetical protein SAMN05421644_14910 [Allochromatium warmingii]|uniref:Rhamnan synthesis protein F n=1 Tax=Allochromatium warmingii TaxID=61595 RepID=A0A1H3IX67_ALLWA|nr:hypothetical protein [Allochromatium warmingii]SDY32242.1 hypothetical protein SAMN05421644_14910 [Allochromatium warmingii]
MKYLISFADSRMRRSLERLSKQASEFSIFNAIYLLDECDLSSEFRRQFKDRLIFGSRGYGYWSWKPEVIASVLDKISDGDCLLYLDAGCHLNLRGKKRLIEYFDILEKADKGIIAFQADAPNSENSNLRYDGRKLFNQPNLHYIKGDLLDYFETRGNTAILNAQAIGAGVILIKKSKDSVAIINEWKKIIWERFDLVDDTPSVSPNLLGFIEHRHDQAIWTLLCIKHCVKTLSAYEYWYPKSNTEKLIPDWDALQNFPIHAKRDKDFGYLRNTVIKLNRLSYRLESAILKLKNI